MGRSDNDIRAKQLNPNNDAYWQSRGWEWRPEDWEELIREAGEPEQAKLKKMTRSRR